VGGDVPGAVPSAHRWWEYVLTDVDAVVLGSINLYAAQIRD